MPAILEVTVVTMDPARVFAFFPFSTLYFDAYLGTN